MARQQSIKMICTSLHHNNTRRLAETIAEVLSATIHSVDEAAALEISDSIILGFGSGIYFGRHHHSLLTLVNSWPTRPCRVFIFSTAGLPFLRWLQHYALRKRLVRRGFQVVGEFCCRGWDTVGPLWLIGGINRRHPDEKDLERARTFALELSACIQPSAS